MPYGYAPYEEAASKGQARVSLMQRLGQIFSGAGAGIAAARGSTNPIESIALGFSGGFGQANAARQAAEAYAMKKIEAENQRRHQDFQDRLMQSEIDKNSRPVPPEKVPGKQQDYEHLISLGRTPDEARQIVYGLTAGEQTAQKKAAADASGEVQPPMSDAALDMTAEVYAKTGLLPSLGMRAATLREKILERAAKKYPGVDVAQNRAGFASDQSSLKNLQGNYDQTVAFGNTFEKNARPLESMVNSIPNLGIRWGNHVGRWLASQAGSAKVAQFHSQMGVVRPEAQRILQFAGTGGNMALTDSQARDMRAILADDFTPAQLHSALATLRQDRENKLSSYKAQIDAIRGRLHDVGGGQGANMNDPLGVR